MLKKTFFLSLVVCLFALSVASAATYGVYLVTPAQIGDVQLTPGTYKMKVDGGKITLTDKNKKASSFNGKVEKLDKKALYTEVIGATSNGVQKVTAIQIGATTVKVVFE